MYSVSMSFLVQGGSEIPTHLLYNQLLWGKMQKEPSYI